MDEGALYFMKSNFSNAVWIAIRIRGRLVDQVGTERCALVAVVPGGCRSPNAKGRATTGRAERLPSGDLVAAGALHVQVALVVETVPTPRLPERVARGEVLQADHTLVPDLAPLGVQ